MSETTPQPTVTPPTQDHLLSNKLYDVLHFLAMILLPAIGTLYFALAAAWNLPNGESVLGTITAVDVFLGGFLKVSKASYDASDAKYDGVVNVLESAAKKTYSLEVKTPVDDLDKQKQVTLKVQPAVAVDEPPLGD